MKNNYFLFIILFTSSAVFSQTDTCFSRFASTSPVVDGYSTDAAYTNWKTYSGVYGNNNNISFSSAWDYNFFYVAVNVNDLSLYQDSPDPWNDDAVELYIDANNNRATTYDSYDRQYRINYNITILSGIGSTTGVLHYWRTISGGYSVEFAIPWTNLGVSPSTGFAMGLDINNSDDDNGGDAEGGAYWQGNGNDWQNTSAFGQVTLTGAAGMPQLIISSPASDVNVFRSSVFPVTWTSSYIDSIYIEKSENGQAWQHISTVKATNNSYTPSFSSIMPGTTVQFRLSESINHLPNILSYTFTVIDSSTRILLRANNRFHVYGWITEAAAADTVIEVLSGNYDRIADSLNGQLTQYVTVDIYHDLATYHNAMGWPTAPDWVVGNSVNETNIQMVSPYNPGPVHTFSGVIGIIAHELIHCFVHKIANGLYVSIWLNEGTATYISYMATNANDICYLIDLNAGKPDLATINNYSTFGDIGGYSFSYTIAEFIATELGDCGLLSQFIASGSNYSVLGFADETAFTLAWHQFLDDKYPCSHVGIDDPTNKDKVVVYPNPADDHVTVSVSGDFGKYEVLLYTGDGRICYHEKNISSSEHSINVSSYSPGLYLVFIKTETETITKKIVK